jgi:threonine dehydrogenase-like Zn-dependent dehydrogenase
MAPAKSRATLRFPRTGKVDTIISSEEDGMKSLQYQGGGVVEWVDLPDPKPGPGQVLVRTAVSALCGSEKHTYLGAGQKQGNPGHEAAGTIVAVGPSVSLRRGQRVGVSGVTGCGTCDYCRAGQQTYCQHRPAGFGGFHADLILVDEFTCVPLPDDIPWDAGVLLTGDGLGVPYHTSRRLLDPEIVTVAVFGQGPIGLGNTLMHATMGRRVISVDMLDKRLDYARGLGASEVIWAAKDGPVEAILHMTDGIGADVCIECAGRPDTLRQCFAAVRAGGTIAVNGEQGPLQLSPSDDFIRRDVTMFGSWFYQYAEVPAMFELYRHGMRVTDLVTHRFAAPRAQEAWSAFAAGETGKVLLMYGA